MWYKDILETTEALWFWADYRCLVRGWDVFINTILVYKKDKSGIVIQLTRMKEKVILNKT